MHHLFTTDNGLVIPFSLQTPHRLNEQLILNFNKKFVIQVNLNYSVFTSQKITTPTISTKSRERTVKSIYAKRENLFSALQLFQLNG